MKRILLSTLVASRSSLATVSKKVLALSGEAKTLVRRNQPERVSVRCSAHEPGANSLRLILKLICDAADILIKITAQRAKDPFENHSGRLILNVIKDKFQRFRRTLFAGLNHYRDQWYPMIRWFF